MKRSYPRDRLIEEAPEGFSVITPIEYDDPIPLGCSICKRLYRSYADEEAHREFGCCDLCAMRWAHARRDEWRSGWRPSQEDVDEVVANRPPMVVTFDMD